jgi:hypothetical protein
MNMTVFMGLITGLLMISALTLLQQQPQVTNAQINCQPAVVETHEGRDFLIEY